MKSNPYPAYRTYEAVGHAPSVLAQEYPRPRFANGDRYYRIDSRVHPLLSSEEELTKFEAANFSGFLQDTIDVEHHLVIPAVATLKRLPYEIPTQALQDLFKTATDEGFHAEQSLQFLDFLQRHFSLLVSDDRQHPLFLLRLKHEIEREHNAQYKDLITVLNGVITETRISIELSKFASDDYLAEPVRNICRSHADDEIVHASQFKALGEWLWKEFDETTKVAAARFLTSSTISRNLIDVDRLAYYLYQSTGRSIKESQILMKSIYTVDVQIEALLNTANPTISFLKKLGVEKIIPFNDSLADERARMESF